MHLDISLKEILMPELSMEYVMTYIMDNQVPTHMGNFESFASIGDKLLKMISPSLKRKEITHETSREKQNQVYQRKKKD